MAGQPEKPSGPHLRKYSRKQVADFLKGDQLDEEEQKIIGRFARKRKSKPEYKSKVLKWYGSVTPKERPEDFGKVREEFENDVAEDVDKESNP